MTVDGVVTITTPASAGRLEAPVAAPGWVCTGTRASPVAQCNLAVLPPSTSSRLVLRVSVDESYDSSDGAVAMHVTGGGVDFQAPPIPVRVAPAPARLTLSNAPAALTLLTGRSVPLSLELRNAGGSVATGPTVRVAVPDGVEARPSSGDWSCETTGDVVTCSRPSLGARVSAPLTLSSPPRGLAATAPSQWH